MVCVSLKMEDGSDEDTNTIVQKIISDIDPELSPTDIERSHRVWKLSDGRGHNYARPRQFILRLTNTIVKRRILKCRTSLKSYSKYKHVYINEDLTRTRNKLPLPSLSFQTLCDLSMSVGDNSGSISEIIFWTIVFVSSSDPSSLMPATRIRLIRPYCTSESRLAISSLFSRSRG
jgi:hypothetical protein